MADDIDPSGELGLADLIRRVREELEDADRERRLSGEDALLALKGVDLELQFTLTRRKDGKGGIDLKVISVEGAKGVESSAVHSVSVQFEVDPEARQRRVPGTRAHATTTPVGGGDEEPIEDT